MDDFRPIVFTVPGEPVGKGRHRSVTRKRRDKVTGEMGTYTARITPPRTEAYERAVADSARQAMQGRDLVTGPVLIELRMFHPVPRSWSKKRQALALTGEVMPTVKCDADNCLKAVSDALNGTLWRDDTQVVNVILAKRYAEVPRVEVRVVPLMAEGAQK